MSGGPTTFTVLSAPEPYEGYDRIPERVCP